MQHEEWIDLNGEYCRHSLDTSELPDYLADQINEDKIDEFLYDFKYDIMQAFVRTYRHQINPEYLSS